MNASFCKRSKAYLFLFLEPRIKQRVSQRNLHCLLRVLKNLFPNSSSVTLKERDTVNSTANLSTWTQLTNQCMTPESVIMERRHQRHVPSPFPLPRPLPGSLSLQIFDHVFCLFPLLWGLVPGYLSGKFAVSVTSSYRTYQGMTGWMTCLLTPFAAYGWISGTDQSQVRYINKHDQQSQAIAHDLALYLINSLIIYKKYKGN